jgi:hypothetical protein
MITEELLKYKKISKNIFCLGILNLIVLISFIIINNNIYGFYNILLKIFGDEALIAFFLYLPLFSFFVFYFALFLLAQIGISIFLFFKGLKKEALLNIIIFLLLAGFFFVYIINEKVNPNSRTNTYNQVAENKYQELENLFNNEILVSEISQDYVNLYSEGLDYSIYITPIISENDKENFPNLGEWATPSLYLRYRPDFRKYVLNKKVKLVLPSKDYFNENYCCNVSDPNDIHYNKVIIRAFIYADGKLLNFNDYPLE